MAVKPEWRKRGFDSGYEASVYDQNKSQPLNHHPLKVEHTVTYTYEPDYSFEVPDSDLTILVETKGAVQHFLGDKRKRFLFMKEQLPENYRVVMMIQKAVKLPDRKKMGIDDWARNSRIPYCIGTVIPDKWRTKEFWDQYDAMIEKEIADKNRLKARPKQND